jgi:hypothetical protein
MNAIIDTIRVKCIADRGQSLNQVINGLGAGYGNGGCAIIQNVRLANRVSFKP